MMISSSDLYHLYFVENKTAKEIAKIYNCSNVTIYKYLRKNGFKVKIANNKPKYSKNDNYFSSSTVQNSYWAGFIGADGCISKSHNIYSSLKIKLKDTDKNHLLNFKEDIDYTGPIIDNIAKKPKKDSYKYKKQHYNQSTIQIYSAKQIISDLNSNFNITPQKSLILQPPNLTNKDEILSYIIGYIDGDGHISNGKPRLSIVGNKEILDWINNIFNNSGKVYSEKRSKSYYLQFNIKDSIKILVKLQNIITKYNLKVLDRKWNKIREYFGVLV